MNWMIPGISEIRFPGLDIVSVGRSARVRALLVFRFADFFRLFMLSHFPISIFARVRNAFAPSTTPSADDLAPLGGGKCFRGGVELFLQLRRWTR